MANLKILRDYVFSLFSRKILEFELFVSLCFISWSQIFWAIVFFLVHGWKSQKQIWGLILHGTTKTYRKAMVLTIVTLQFL